VIQKSKGGDGQPFLPSFILKNRVGTRNSRKKQDNCGFTSKSQLTLWGKPKKNVSSDIKTAYAHFTSSHHSGDYPGDIHHLGAKAFERITAIRSGITPTQITRQRPISNLTTAE
jgi:hypothetical protein